MHMRMHVVGFCMAGRRRDGGRWATSTRSRLNHNINGRDGYALGTRLAVEGMEGGWELGGGILRSTWDGSGFRDSTSEKKKTEAGLGNLNNHW